MIHGWDKQAWEWHGAEEVYPSFWKTVVTSKQWEEWEAEVDRRLHEAKYEKAFDTGESRECGWLSPDHFQAFLEFITNNKKNEHQTHGKVPSRKGRGHKHN